MELSDEDALRLHVLLANAEAIRIDPGAMVVYGLVGEEERQVPLHPTGGDDRYLQAVRELLSGQVLGSPRGYPVLLRRWTQMGQPIGASLEKLLLLGEPEAVAAVSGSERLTDELARRAWWAAPEAENARRMLQNRRIAMGAMGTVVAEHLLEYLPFETEHLAIIDSMRLLARPGLLPEERRHRLWNGGRHRNTLRTGFLLGAPDDLPDPLPARADYGPLEGTLAPLCTAESAAACLLMKLLSGHGQTFLAAAESVLRRPADQEVVNALLNAIGAYCGAARVEPGELREMEAIRRLTATLTAGGKEHSVDRLLELQPDLRPEVEAMFLLAHIDEAVVTPIFAHTDAVGTVMRRKLEPVTAPLAAAIARLRTPGPAADKEGPSTH